MNTIETIETIKALDEIAAQSNALWRKCESLKMHIADRAGISPNKLRLHGIFVEEVEKQSNARVNPVAAGDPVSEANEG